MPNALVVSTLGADSGIPKDAFVNTFSFLTDANVNATTGAELAFVVQRFYNQATAAGPTVAGTLSPFVDRTAGAHGLKVYDVTNHLDGSPHGSPVFSSVGTMGPQSGTDWSLPEEVACVVTLRGVAWEDALIEAPDGSDSGSLVDRPRQRLSGRVFMGPFHVGMNSTSSTKSAPASALQTILLDAFEQHLCDFPLANYGHHLAVWSRANAEMNLVTDVQVDNAWDTQRRRGVAPSSRTTRDVT